MAEFAVYKVFSNVTHTTIYVSQAGKFFVGCGGTIFKGGKEFFLLDWSLFEVFFPNLKKPVPLNNIGNSITVGR